MPMVLTAGPKLFEGVAVAAFTGIMFLVATVAHEAAHAVAARSRSLPVKLISIGDGAFCSCGDLTAKQLGILVFAAGAAANLVLAAAIASVSVVFKPDGTAKAFVEAAMQVNLLLGVSNLMPAFGLDGGWIACLVLERLLPPRLADTIVGSVGLVIEAMSIVMLVALFAAGWPLAWSISGRSLDLLRWTWRKPPPPPPDQPELTDRPVPAWLIRYPRHRPRRRPPHRKSRAFHRPANHGSSRRIASVTSGVETAKEKRRKR